MTPFRTLPVLLALTVAPVAQDDRDRTTPTANQFLTGQTTSNLQALANSGWRITDLEIESTSPWSFAVAVVANTGAYYKDWSYSIGVTETQLRTALAQANMRPIDVEPYVDAGTARFVAVMIGNTGADAKTWTWYAGASGPHQGNSTRPISLNRYTLNGQPVYSEVAIANTGADYYSWNPLLAAPASLIDDRVDNQGFRIYDLGRRGTDSYDAVMLLNQSHRQWYYFDRTAAQVQELLQQNLARAIDIERHTLLVLGTRYDVVMLDNANTLERTARQHFLNAPVGALGKHGFFLKQVNGPVLAEMRADTAFEPAGLMGTVYHAHAMKQVANGAATLTMQLPKPLSCGVAGANQGLEPTLRQMMENDDELATLAIGNQFGITNIDATAGALGMASTDINYTIGCSGPSPQSTMTLRDLSTLHEQVANGYLGAQRAKFYELMQEQQAFPSGIADTLESRIDFEAATYGMPASVRDAFKSTLHVAYQQAGTSWFQGGSQHYYHAGGGWLAVPWKNSFGQITVVEYTFGAFHHDFPSQQTAGSGAMWMAQLELMWDVVQPALATWAQHVAGSVSALPGAGCAGSAGTPVHGAVGTAELGETVLYRLSFAPANAIFVAVFGFSSSDYQGIPLPLDLGVIGASGCMLRTSVDVQMVGIANGHGVGSTAIDIGTDPSTIGTTWFSQHLVLDPPVNAFGATLSNAWQTTVGGWL